MNQLQRRKTASNSDKQAIRKLIRDWAAATRENRTDDILSAHDSRAIIFDVLAPLQYRGIAAYKRSWADWQPAFEVPSLFEIKELKISVGGRLAFCHFLIRCGGKLPSAEIVEDVVRATICLRKESRKWKIAHQHISMPMTK